MKTSKFYIEVTTLIVVIGLCYLVVEDALCEYTWYVLTPIGTAVSVLLTVSMVVTFVVVNMKLLKEYGFIEDEE